MAKKSTAADASATTLKRTAGSRIYVVYEGEDPKALVSATSAAAALRHFTGADKYIVRYAEQTDLFAAAKANLAVVRAASAEDPA